MSKPIFLITVKSYNEVGLDPGAFTELGTIFGWNREMDKFIGKTFRAIGSRSHGTPCYISIGTSGRWNFSAEWLSKIEKIS